MSYKILVVDDNTAIHEDFERVLAPQDHDFLQLANEFFGDESMVSELPSYELTCAERGQDALELVQKQLDRGEQFAVAFVDVRMPSGWDGIETIQRLWEEDSSIQVVICTAYSDYDWDDIQANLGSNDNYLILRKPFDAMEVKQMVQSLSTKWELGRQAAIRMDQLESIVRQKTQHLESVNRQLKENQRQLVLQEKLASIGQLAAGVAHEINTPLGSVLCNSTLLRENLDTIQHLLRSYQTLSEQSAEDVPEAIAELRTSFERAKGEELMAEAPELLTDIIEGSKRVSAIVQSLNCFARTDEERVEWDINKGIETTLRILHNRLKQKCEVKTELGELPLVECSPGQINQVLLNLLVNAEQAIQEQGIIAVRSSTTENDVVIEIQDSGGGIPPEVIGQIFDPFFTTKAYGEGTGLGLAIAQDIVVQHDGRIEADSNSCGTTFSVFLPLKRS